MKDIQVQMAVEHGLVKEADALVAATDAFAQTKALAAISILISQLVEPNIPSALDVPLIISLLDSPDASVQTGACNVLTGLMAADESQWRRLVLGVGLTSKLVAMLKAKPESSGLRINLLAALTLAAQGGEEGAAAVTEADGLAPVLEACSSSGSEKVQEAVADLVCQLASYEGLRAALSDAGAVPVLSGLLGVDEPEVVVRALMGLGMLLPGSEGNQRALAGDQAAVRRLVALMTASADADVKALSRDLFVGLTRSCKDEVAEAMRAASPTGTAS
ncbi:hypothetical protein FOA52_007046 [Chlamydomonas sp. UWO 241]|nr:hypothetical protein FOA52_007046 [Chlamydomonas sp. UWO 241]